MTTWMETYSGDKFDYVDIATNKINIRDIAHGLSQVCRFSGQCRVFYSVATHSVLASRLLKDPVESMLALLHDASEAYAADIPRPLKYQLPEYRRIEKEIQHRVYDQLLGFVPTDEEYKPVDYVDNQMLMLEAEKLLPSQGKTWDPELTSIPKADIELQYWSPKYAEGMFMTQWCTLKSKLSNRTGDTDGR